MSNMSVKNTEIPKKFQMTAVACQEKYCSALLKPGITCEKHICLIS